MSLLWDATSYLSQGIWITVVVTLGGALLAFAVSFLTGFLGLSKNLFLRLGGRIFVEVFRGTSMVVQLFWFFFALPVLTGHRLPALIAGVLTVGLNYGAYGAEVVRGAILAVPKAQWEATVSLSMTYSQKMRRVILPQAWLGMIPPFTNLLIQLLKATALVSMVTLADITFLARQFRRETGDTVLVFTVALVMYFVLAQVLVYGMKVLERRAKRNLGHSLPVIVERVETAELQALYGEDFKLDLPVSLASGSMHSGSSRQHPPPPAENPPSGGAS